MRTAAVGTPGAALTPIAVALRCVPIIAIAPLLVAALGRGPVGTTVVVALMTFFPTLVSCLYGLERLPGQVADVFATYAAPPWRVLLLGRLPAMAPAFFAAARIAGRRFSASWPGGRRAARAWTPRPGTAPLARPRGTREATSPPRPRPAG